MAQMAPDEPIWPYMAADGLDSPTLGCFGPPVCSWGWFWVPVAKVVFFYFTAISKLSILGPVAPCAFLGPQMAPKSGFGRLSPKWYLSVTRLLATFRNQSVGFAVWRTVGSFHSIR